MNVLVTGGAGFIGSNFIDFALKKHVDWKIVCLDVLSYAGSMDNLVGCKEDKRFTFIHGNIVNKEFVYYIFEQWKFDIVINFAAESHVDRSIKNSGIFINSNVAGVDVLLSACVKFGVKRYHQISTDEVYGDLPLDRPDLKFLETTPLCTSSPYAASKAAADLLVQAYYRTYQVPITISRCSNNYGPNHLPEKLIPLMITHAIKGMDLPVYGNGLNVRDWIYVEDHCRAVDVIVNSGKPGEIYNVGGGSEKSNIEVVQLILKCLNLSEEKICYVNDRPGHDVRYAIDYTKINKELSWQPLTKFEDGIAKTVKWYLENKAWWENAFIRMK